MTKTCNRCFRVKEARQFARAGKADVCLDCKFGPIEVIEKKPKTKKPTVHVTLSRGWDE